MIIGAALLVGMLLAADNVMLLLPKLLVGGRGLGGRPSHATGLNRVFDRWLGAGWGAARERGRLGEVVDVFGSARMGANK